MRKRVRIWLVTDGKPGHQNQTEGLIQGIARYRDVEVKRYAAMSLTKSVWMLIIGKCGLAENRHPDLILGAGHQTHLSLLALRRCSGGKAVVMMRPSLPLRLFDLCFIPRHDKPKQAENIIETIGPVNRIIPSKSLNEGNGLKQRQGLVLLGGHSRHFGWDSERVVQQVETLLLKNKDIKWIIAGSRRTPADCYDALSVKLSTHETAGFELIRPDQVDADWLPEIMQQSEQIWVTQDSVSMVFEALTSGAKTGLIRLPGEKPTRVCEEINRLIYENRVSTLSSNRIHIQPSVLNEANRCAKRLLEEFNLLR